MPSLTLQLKNVSRRFYRPNGTSFNALKNISFEVEHKDVFGIVGMSGAGKSTLLRLLATLDQPDAGSMEVNGVAVNDYSHASLQSLRQNIGMVFQELYLYSGKTVIQNILLPMSINRALDEERQMWAKELLALVNLQDKEHCYPLTLSGGEKQRVAIARALAHRPRLLLCDELTSALDPKSRRAILELLQELKEKLSLTIVLITHEMELVRRICNRVIVLDQGQIIEQGSVEDLFASATHPITRALLQQVEHELPLTELPQAEYWLLTFRGNAARQPLLSQTIRRFQVEVNILSGTIDKTAKEEIGRLLIAIVGEEKERLQALDFLKTKGVHCHPLGEEP